MNLWAKLTDFSEFDARIPCVLCKGDSEKTVIGNHWKCQKCDHLFNQDKSNLNVECYCKTCKPETEMELPVVKDLKKKVTKKKNKI